MKVKVVVTREIEVEINDKDFNAWADYVRSDSTEMSLPLCEKAVEAIEKVVGLPFGSEEANETIISVCDAEDNEPILEW